MIYGYISEQLGVNDKVSIYVQNDSATIEESLLHPEERVLISPKWSDKRKRTFTLGRLAAKQAMAAYETVTYPVLRGSMNEPLWPDMFKGSISHKDTIAIAAVTKNNSYKGIGIDIEDTGFIPDDTHARLFCTDEEMPYVEKNRLNALLFFSIKESFIKASYMAHGKLIEMTAINCLQLQNSSPDIKVRYILWNQHIISLCLIHQKIKNKNYE